MIDLHESDWAMNEDVASYFKVELENNLKNLTSSEKEQAWRLIKEAWEIGTREYRARCREESMKATFDWESLLKNKDKKFIERVKDEYWDGKGDLEYLFTALNLDSEKQKTLVSFIEDFYVAGYEDGYDDAY